MWKVGGGCEGRVVDVEREWMWREVTPVLLVLQSLPTHAILYTWATLSTSPTDISLSTGVVTLVTGVILFTWATLSMTPTDISLSTGTIGGWWMWRKGGCEGRVVDVEEWWMWREGGCGGR